MTQVSRLAHDPDPVRQFIERRLSEIGMSNAQLSRALNRDASYINQYFRRGYPLELDARTRRAVAEILGVDERALISTGTREPVQTSPAAAERHVRLVQSGKYIPVFEEGKPIDWEAVPEWLPRPSFVSLAGLSFALQIRSDHGRVIEGDTAFVSGGRPPRADDLAVVMSAAEQQLVAIGTVSKINPEAVTLKLRETTSMFDRVNHQVLKIVGVHFV